MSSSSEAEFQDESEEEFMADDSSSSEDLPLSSLKKSPAEEDSDDESDSDVPLASLKSKKKSTTKKKPKKKTEKKTPAKKKKIVKKASSSISSKAAASSASTSNTDYQTVSAAFYGTQCKKGLLIQRLLCRWWYATEWPDPQSLPEAPPPYYDAMDGFPGVYVCTSGDKVGHIWDMRDQEKCPNFVNYCKKPAAELQTLLLSALGKQRQALVQAEGSGTPTEKEVSDMLKWAQKLKPETVDKEAVKVLKAYKLSLP